MKKKMYKYLKKSLSGYFNLLLTALILLFIFRPHNQGEIYRGIWQLFFILMLFSAIYNAHHSKFIRTLAFCFGIPSLILHWIASFYPIKGLIIGCLSFGVVFITICTISILIRVVVRARVTLETLKGAICAYFLVAFGFAFAFFLVELIIPDSFHISFDGGAIYSYTHYLSEMIYFSFVSLLTIGYGDINATKDIAQTLTILEGIIGQFYIAILVARLVAVYSLLENKTLIKHMEKDHKN